MERLNGKKDEERTITAIDRGGGEFSMMCNVGNEVERSSTRRFKQRQATSLLPGKENRNNLSTQSSPYALNKTFGP